VSVNQLVKKRTPNRNRRKKKKVPGERNQRKRTFGMLRNALLKGEGSCSRKTPRRGDCEHTMKKNGRSDRLGNSPL